MDIELANEFEMDLDFAIPALTLLNQAETWLQEGKLSPKAFRTIRDFIVAQAEVK